jgi:myo-inositol-1(or 4)-monophosphatase
MWEGDVWVALRAARAGADIVDAGLSEILDTEMKGEVDPVTQVDRAAEEAIMGTIAHHFPKDHLLGEEGGGSDWREGRVWIVDPLDGTVNFVHRIPQSAVSVALWEDGAPLVGVIIDVARDEEFVAVRDGGATLNGEPITVSDATRLEDAMVLTGFPYDQRDHARSYLEIIESLLVEARAVRVMGSAALDLAWIAAGRGDGYCEHGGARGLKPWDLAAGALLVTEAGGTFTDHRGRPDQLEGAAFVASNGKIHEELRSIVAGTLPGHLM